MNDRRVYTRFFLVRHAEAIANTEMRYLGSQDDPLTERGVRQAQRLGEALAPLPIARVYTSPLVRARDTAAQIARGRGLSFIADSRLREGSFGDWEGLSRSEVMARSPQDAKILASWESDPSGSPPNGESFKDIQARILAFVEELRDGSKGQWTVLVSHVGPIKALLAAAIGAPSNVGRRLFLDPATISVVDWGAPPVVRLFNSHAHLGWQAAKWMTE